MDKIRLRVSYDPETDLLEVFFGDEKEGYYSPMGKAGFMARYDESGDVAGFAVHDLSLTADKPIDIEIRRKEVERAE